MPVLQHYQIPLTLVTFVNCYKRMSSLRLSNQALWLRDKTMMLVLATGAAGSWTFAVTLGCSSSMAGHLVTNQGSSFVWQMGGSIVNYIVGSPAVWQTTIDLEVIINDTRYCVMWATLTTGRCAYD